MEKVPLDEVVEGVNRELDLMRSFPVHQAVPRAELTGKVWSTRWCYRKEGPKQVRGPTPPLEVTRVLLAMALSKQLTILFGDIGVAVMNTPMPEGDPVYVEPPDSLYEHNDTVWCLKRALIGLRDASRLFHEHFAAVLTSRLGFRTIRSTANAFRGSCA